MAQDFFILNSAGDFATAANWTSGVPTSTEDAEIDSTGGFAVSTVSETVNSIGTDSGDGLLIGGGVFVVADGSGPEENQGSISVVDATFAMEDGTFVNPGLLSLAGYNSSNVGTLIITDSVELAGSGQVAMTIGGGPSANTIEGFSFVEVPTLTNDNDTISGDGTISGLNFINTAGGLIETNNSSSTSGGDMQIEGSAGGGSFTNDGFMEINNGGKFVFGVSSDTTIDNDGSIILQGANKLTRLAVIGVVTISAAGDGGRIELEGSTPADDSIVTTGLDAALILDKQTLDGAGSIDDPELSLDLLSGAIIADVPNQELFVAPANLTNDDTLAAIDGGELVLNGPVENKGIITVSGAGSIVEIFHRGSVAGPGIFKIGTGGSLQVVGSASGLFGFVGPDATILLGPAGVLQGTINGMEASDAIDVTGVAFLQSIQAVWQQNGATGTLSLVNNGSALAMFALSGQYTAADFDVSGDGEGGTSIQMLNPGPPAGTTADLIMRDNGDYEIYDLGSNSILAARALGQIVPQWQVAGIGSFSDPDTSDMMLRDSVDGSFQVDDVSSNNITNTVAMGQVGMEWQVSGFGDLSSRPGETDMLMRDSSNGDFEVFDISNNTITSAAPMGQVGSEWSVAGFGVFSTQSDETDLLMRNSNTGQFELFDIMLDAINAAIFLVNSAGWLVHANAAGRAMLSAPSVIHIEDGRLAGKDQGTDRALREAFATAVNSDKADGTKSIVVPFLASGGEVHKDEHYLCHVLPLAGKVRRHADASYAVAAALFVHKAFLNLPSPREAIAKAYKLTAMELRVLLAIVEVGGVPEVAEALGVAESTVKTHLGRIFTKTNSNRQADLVKIVAGFASPIAR